MKIKKMMIGAVMGVIACASLLIAQPAMAVNCPSGSIKSSADTLAGCNVKDDEDDLMKTVQTIINVIISVLGIVAVIVIVLGGVTYTTSQGDAAKVAKAKNTIIYGVVGLVIALLAYAIVNFVLYNVFGGGADGGDSSDGSSEDTSLVIERQA